MADAIQDEIRQAQIQKLQLEMNLRFQKNMILFEKRFPSLFKLLKNHTPKDPNSQLNLLNPTKRCYFYNEKPKEYCDKQVDKFKQEVRVRRMIIDKSRQLNEEHLHIKHVNIIIVNSISCNNLKLSNLQSGPKKEPLFQWSWLIK